MVRLSTYETFLPPESPSKKPVPPLSLREKATVVADNLRLRANAALVAWQSVSGDPITMELRSRKVPRSRSPSRSSPTSHRPGRTLEIESRGKVGIATTLAGVGVLLLACAIPSAKRLPTAADQCNPDQCHMRVRSFSEADDIAALEAAATWHQASSSAAEARLASAEAALTWHQAAAEAAESQLASTKEEAARLERLLQYTSGRLAEERQQTQRRQRDEAEACEARVAEWAEACEAKEEEWAAIVAASETALAQGAARWAAERSELIAAAEAAAEESLARCEAAAQVGNVARRNPTTSRPALRALRPPPPHP